MDAKQAAPLPPEEDEIETEDDEVDVLAEEDDEPEGVDELMRLTALDEVADAPAFGDDCAASAEIESISRLAELLTASEAAPESFSC